MAPLMVLSACEVFQGLLREAVGQGEAFPSLTSRTSWEILSWPRPSVLCVTQDPEVEQSPSPGVVSPSSLTAPVMNRETPNPVLFHSVC